MTFTPRDGVINDKCRRRGPRLAHTAITAAYMCLMFFRTMRYPLTDMPVWSCGVAYSIR